MSQTIQIAGATYPDVPSILVPKQGGGSAVFADPSGVDAVAADVASGKIFMKADGTLGTGTASGGGGTTPAEEKDVNLIDYDGTILYSYTAAEFANLSVLPSNPTHDGLTAQGWNWSLAGAKTYVAANKKLWIGQKYKSSDGKTKLYCTFHAGMLSPYLCFPINGTVKINWGDGSAEDTVTGTSGTTTKSTQHTYAAPGRYVISIEVVSGYFSFYGSSNMSYLLRKVLNTTLNSNRVALACLDRVVFGDNARTGQYAFFHCENLRNVVLGAGVNISSNAFQNCLMLESLTIPATCTLSGSVFRSCYGLQNISFPEGFSFSSGYTYCFSGCTGLTTVSLPGSTVAGYTFQSCSNLREVIIPSGADKIDANTFQADASVAALTIPASVTTIGASAFSNMYGLYEIHFKGATPPTAGSNAFQNLPTACIIYVPTGKVSAYQGEANYPSSSTYTYVEE